ncbi:hypothetical protein PVAP13_3NG152000 [Panicum virgatum]|uniref:Uncharacterized protein n=1 Tax=Panicum virgatum TaxID=38727 RepID=A0A8T0UJC9_PANVG|nr:hypothetical protein PVAP13_9NG422070 [Panicum virgatum]KAG2620963.1 hypothetical protein PVAP13_3NG152000 [Panicum virgatum]
MFCCWWNQILDPGASSRTKLRCCSFIFCWIVTFWSNFNQTLLLLVHILDEIYLLLLLVNCVKSWNVTSSD